MEWHVTGIKADGKRFKIVTKSYYHAMMINIYRGSVWKVDKHGKRTLVKREWN